MILLPGKGRKKKHHEQSVFVFCFFVFSFFYFSTSWTPTPAKNAVGCKSKDGAKKDVFVYAEGPFVFVCVSEHLSGFCLFFAQQWAGFGLFFFSTHSSPNCEAVCEVKCLALNKPIKSESLFCRRSHWDWREKEALFYRYTHVKMKKHFQPLTWYKCGWYWLRLSNICQTASFWRGFGMWF